MALVVKKLPANRGDTRDAGSIPRLGRSPGERDGNTLLCSCLGNPMDRGVVMMVVMMVVVMAVIMVMVVL